VSLAERSTHGHVATVTLSRPDALNAISGDMARELATHFRSVAADAEVWVVLLTAAGEKAFCVGADLKERGRLDDDGWMANRGRIRELFDALRSIPQPTVASVFGYALGGGFELALSCDLIVAADDALFGLPETTVGIVPGGGGTQLLARRAGIARARELIFTGRRLAASEAHALGIVDRMAPREELTGATMALAQEIMAASPVAVREAKRAIEEGFGVRLADGLELEDRAWRAAVSSEDRREGIAAFNQKRAPEWKSR